MFGGEKLGRDSSRSAARIEDLPNRIPRKRLADAGGAALKNLIREAVALNVKRGAK
jgi:hypothetical protein